MFTVVVADEELIFAEALTSVLRADDRLRALPAVSTAEDLARVVAHDPPDVAIVGSTLGSEDGSVVVPEWAGRDDGTQVLLIARETRLEDVTLALQKGASGWVAKNASTDELLSAVKAVAEGNVHVPASLLTSVVRVLADARQAQRAEPRPLDALTQREREVLGCMVAGLNRDQISKRLFVSPNTVRTHMQNVLRKLDVHSSLAAAAYARRHGITGPERDGAQHATAP